jgi:hypothetical protein
VKRICANLLKEEFRASQIAVLSPWAKGNQGSSLTHLDRVSTTPYKGAPDDLALWQADKCIYATTVKAFKGLEADCVIITDVPTPETTGFEVADLYVAASRAKHRLVLMPASDEAAVALRKYIIL